jgi:chemotaxis protein CheD
VNAIDDFPRTELAGAAKSLSAQLIPMSVGKWVIPAPRKTLVVGVADMAASNDGSAELVTYSLGSCLGVAIYDPVKKVGGLLHAMLPDSTIDSVKAVKLPFMFMDTGVPRLFHAVYNLGADRQRLVIKVAGGAQLLDPNGIFNIGERNYRVLLELLARNGLMLHACDVGGQNSRTLRLDMTTGNITIKSSGNDLYSL